MKETLKQYLQKHYSFERLFEKPQETNNSLGFNKYKLSGSKRFVMYALQISPYLCASFFTVTFLIPLLVAVPVLQMVNGTGLYTMLHALENFYTQNLAIFEVIQTVSVSGLIGFGTNYIAIRMLFRPIEKRPIWGQGLIPGQRDRIIFTLAKGMHKHILNQDLIRLRIEESGIVKKVNGVLIDGSVSLLQDEDLKNFLKKAVFDGMKEYAQREEFRKEIRHAIESRLEEKIDGGVKKFLYQTYKRYNKEEYEDAIDNIIQEIPKVAMEVIDKLEQDLNRLAAYFRLQKQPTEDYIMGIIVDILNRIDITGILAKQMEHFDEAKLEKMVWEATNEQLLYIQYLGTILGVLGGFLIWNSQLMGGIYIIGFGLLYLLDILIFRMKKRGLRQENS